MKKSLFLAGMILAVQQNNAFAAAGDKISDLSDSEGLIARAAAASPVSDEDYALLVAAGVEGEGKISDRHVRRASRDQQKLESLLQMGSKRDREEDPSEPGAKAARVVLGQNNLTNRAGVSSKGNESGPRIRSFSEIQAARGLLALGNND
jgi:hypothetical protein